MVRRSRDCFYGWVEGAQEWDGGLRNGVVDGKSWEGVHSAAAARPGSDDEYYHCHLSWFCDIK